MNTLDEENKDFASISLEMGPMDEWSRKLARVYHLYSII